MNRRICAYERCSAPLPVLARSDARFCSVRCRVAAHREVKAEQPIPLELRSRDRWVRHVDKRPVTVAGRSASSTSPRTWASYDDAAASTIGDGLGFVLNGDGIVCVDLDHCLVDGHVTEWAAPLLKALPATYIEVSPSGEGLHVWGTGRLPRGRVIGVPGGRVELYGAGRYLTVTGQRFRGAPSTLAPLGDFIAAL